MRREGTSLLGLFLSRLLLERSALVLLVATTTLKCLKITLKYASTAIALNENLSLPFHFVIGD